jgi:hypothetical protein
MKNSFVEADDDDEIREHIEMKADRVDPNGGGIRRVEEELMLEC